MIFRFGLFELDMESELLISQAGKVVPRDDIRAALWPAETFVDYWGGLALAVLAVVIGALLLH
jgi:hypothetical protein